MFPLSRDLGGRRIRVHLERDSHHDPQVRRPSDQQVLGFAGPPPRSQDGYWHHEQSNGVAAFHSQSPPPSDPSSPIPPRLPWALNMSLNGTQTKPARGPPEVIGLDGTPHLNFRQMRHPGPISMPPFPVLDNGNPLSPLQTRNLPPMTPSMPDFVFNAYPETPPIHAHFLSPGLGPFSPGIPVTSSPEFVYNPFLNPAPGAPVNRYPQGGSAALGTPTTQSFPNNPIHGYSATSGHQNITQALAEAEYFPAQLPRSVPDPPSPLPLASSRLNPPTSPVNAKDRLSSNGAEEGASDQTRMTASMSLNDTRRPTPPSPTARSVQPQRIVSGLNLVDLARGEMQAGRASLDGRRPMLDVGWTGERRASFGDIGSRESK